MPRSWNPMRRYTPAPISEAPSHAALSPISNPARAARRVSVSPSPRLRACSTSRRRNARDAMAHERHRASDWLSVEVGNERGDVRSNDRLVVKQQWCSFAFPRIVVSKRDDAAQVNDRCRVRNHPHLNCVRNGAGGRRVIDRHRPFGPACAEPGGQRGALDVLVIRAPHQHDETRRLICEELNGLSHGRAAIDKWIRAARDPQIGARAADEQDASLLNDPATRPTHHLTPQFTLVESRTAHRVHVSDRRDHPLRGASHRSGASDSRGGSDWLAALIAQSDSAPFVVRAAPRSCREASSCR